MKRFAILGAGLAGLGVGYFIHQFLREAHITFFDPEGIGGKTSRIASGLLHPYPGKHSRLSRNGHEAFASTMELLEVARKHSDHPVADFSPIEKVTLEEDHFLNTHPDVEKLQDNHYLIHKAATVYTARYLPALFASMQRADLIKERVSLSDLMEYDHVIVAAGAGSLDLGLALPRLSINKGQILTARYPLQRALLGGGYIVKSDIPGLVHVGSTYEHEFADDKPDMSVAVPLIRRLMLPYFPAFDELPFIDCKAGYRVARPDYTPLILQINEGLSVFTSLGSRGLLYHAYYGKKLAKAICFGND